MAANSKAYDSLVQKLRGGGESKPQFEDKSVKAANEKTYKKAVKDFGLSDVPLIDIPVEDRVTIAEFARIWGNKADAVVRYHIKQQTGLITIVSVNPKPPHHIILSRTEAESISVRQKHVDAGGIDTILRMSHDAKPDIEKYRAYLTLPFEKEQFEEGRQILLKEGTSIELICAEAIQGALSRKNGTAKNKKVGKKAV